MTKENLNYSVSDNKVTIDTESLKGNKVIDATITLQAVTFTSQEDVAIVANFVDSAGEVIWENVDTITIKSANSPFIVNISDELQHSIDNNLESAIIQFTTTNTTVEWVLEKVENKAYEDVVYMSIYELMKNSAKHSVDLNSAGNLSVDLVNGMMSLERSILPLRTNALMLNLKHIYTSYFNNIKNKYGLHSNCGMNWKLNTEQYLINELHSSGTELIYLDEYGQEQRLVEEYYYLDDNKEKVYVNKDDVVYDISGALKYGEENVYTECKTSTGLKLVTDKKDIKGAEYVDLEPEELSQIRAQEESITSAISQLDKTISQTEQQLCYLILSEDGSETFDEDAFESKLSDVFKKIVNDEDEQILDDDNISTKLKNIFSLLKTSETDTTICVSKTSADTTTISMQKNNCINSLSTYYQQLGTYLVQHKKIAYQLKIYEEQTPQYYLYSDSVIYGFSKLGKNNYYTLTYVSDYYGNTFIFKYDTGFDTQENNTDQLVSQNGTYNLLYIVDQNENIITFNYKDGLLNSIVDSKENKYNFEYTNEYFQTFSIGGNITARYIYNTANQLVGIVDKNGMGCLLGYNASTNKVEAIKPISALNKIEHQKSLFKTELNLIELSNIEACVLAENDFVKINYYDYKSTSISSVKLVNKTGEDGNVEKIEQINKTITYIFDKYGNTKTTYLNDFDENSPDSNSAYVQNFDYTSDKLTFNSKPYPSAKNFLSGVCFSDSVIASEVENYLGDDLITGDCILCASVPVHTSYHTITKESETKSDSVEVPSTLVLNKISQKISCLTLSGWAKANSGFVINEGNESQEYPDYIKNRKFELRAEITYKEGELETFKKSFDYMNDDWQFVAVPILLDTSKEITDIECYIDYSNNNGNIQYSDLTLCESQYTINEYNNDLLDKSYSSDSKFGRKYEYKDEQLSKIYYIEKDLLINNEYELKKIDLFDVFEYNINGRLWRTTDYNDIVTEKIFDNNGIEIKSLTYHKDNPAEIFYSEQKIDEHGNVVADCNELGDEVTNYTCDTKSGNIVSSKDKNNIETSYGYSKDGSTLLQAITNINGLSNSITYGYTLDFLTKLSHNGFDISYNYDNQGRNTKISVGGSEYATMEYSDMVTKTKFKQDGKDKTVETIQDKDGNVSSINYTSLKYNPENMEENELEEKNLITNVYDTHGQLIGSSDGLTGEEIDYWYDEKCNLTKIQKDDKNFKTCITTNNNEDSSNTHIVIDEYVTQVTNTGEYATEVTISGLSDINYTYTYDTTSVDKNLESIQIKDKDDNVLSYQTIKLDKLGRTKETTNGNLTKQYSYLTRGNHTSNIVSCEKFGLNGVSTDNIRYAYDEKGNITEIRENGVLVNRYAYDSLSRLIREDNKNISKTTTYEYDAGGNILHKVEYSYTLVDNLDYEQGNVINYTYPINGWKDKMLSYNGETCEYDELGNPKVYRNHNLGWNYGRRLMSYDNINYTYDANGIRHTKTVNGVTTHFFTNGTQILGQFDGNLLSFYYGVDGINGFRYSYKNENEVWVHQEYAYKKNILGDIIGIYDENGTQICKYVYDAWGKCRTYVLKDNNFVDISNKVCYTDGSDIYEMMAILNPFRYRGYYFDMETGLYYLNSRYYDPETGRFINADDVSILNTLKDEINGLNLYAYCFNNPINDTDANGNWSLKKFFKSKVGKIIIGATIILAAAALTVATAGGFAAAGAAFAGAVGMSAGTFVLSGLTTFMAGVTIGAITGSLIGAFVGGLSSWASGGNILDGIADGFMWGAISGAISGGVGTFNFGHIGDFGPRGQGNVFQVMCQTAISLGSYIVPSIIKKEQITILGTALSLFGGITGGLLSNSHMLTQVFVSSQVELLGFLKEVWKRLWNISDNNIVLYVN